MTLSKPGLHGDLSPAGSSCQNHSRGAGGQAAGRLSHPLLSHHCLTFLLPPALPSFHDLARIWGMVGGDGERIKTRGSWSRGEGRMLWPYGTLTSPGSTATEQSQCCWARQPGAGHPRQSREQAGSGARLGGAHRAEGSKADPKPGDHSAGRWGVPGRAPPSPSRGLREHSGGHLIQLW